MKVRYTRPALDDLDRILTFIGERSPRGAGRVQAAIKAVEMLLADHPLAGRQTRLAWLRRITAAGFPYVIFYEVAEAEVIIHTVRHTSRAPSSMPGGQ